MLSPISAAFIAVLRTLPALVAVLFAVVLSSSTRLMPGLEAYDEHRLVSVVLLVALGVGAGARAWRQGEGPALSRKVWAALAGAGALGLVSALRAPLPRYGLLDLADTVLLVGAMLEVARQVQRAPGRALRAASVGVLVAVGLMEGLVAVSYAMHLAGVGTPLFPQAGMLFSHPRHFNQVQLWTLPVLVLSVLGASTRRRRLGVGVVLALWWALLFASGGRGATLGLLVGAGVAGVLGGRAAWPSLRVQAFAFAGGIALFLALFPAGPDSLVARRGVGDSGRLRLWHDAGAMIQAHPVLGVGPMHYAYNPPLLRSVHPHNEPLRLLAEWGLPAGLLLLGVTGAGLWGWLGEARRRRDDLEDQEEFPPGSLVALTTALVGAAVLSLVDGVFVMPVSQELGLLTAGLALGVYRARRPVALHAGRGGARAWAAVLLLAAATTVACLFPDVRHLPERQDRLGAVLARRHGQTNNRFPRFWQLGAIVQETPAERRDDPSE